MSRVRLLRGVSRSVLSAQCQGTAPIAVFAVPHSGALGMCTLGRKPSLEDAQLMPRKYYEMPNDVLVDHFATNSIFSPLNCYVWPSGAHKSAQAPNSQQPTAWRHDFSLQVQLSCDWDHEARSERLIREIMVVDDVRAVLRTEDFEYTQVHRYNRYLGMMLSRNTWKLPRRIRWACSWQRCPTGVPSKGIEQPTCHTQEF